MSLALARIELKKYISTDSIHWEMFKNDFMEKEKEQIISAYISDRIPCSEQDAEDYYFSTYKIKKITITEHNHKQHIIELDMIKQEIKKALEKEKEQIIDFTNSFYDDCVTEGGSLKQSAEEYYNQNYKQNK